MFTMLWNAAYFTYNEGGSISVSSLRRMVVMRKHTCETTVVRRYIVMENT